MSSRMHQLPVRLCVRRALPPLCPSAPLAATSRRFFVACTAARRAAGAPLNNASSSPITGAAVPSNVQPQQVADMAAPSSNNGGAAGTADVNATSGNSADSALDVAMRVNKLKRAHQQSSGNKKAIESEAWVALNALTEEQINTAEGKSVALLLNSWAYFAKFWEKGKDGP